MPSRRRRPYFASATRVFFRRLSTLMKQPIFLVLTVIGHGCILGGTVALYYTEYGNNPAVESWLDALYWAVSTVTTVGYGDVHPVSEWGKVVAIVMMVSGSLLFWSYTALFAGALIGPEFQNVEAEVKGLEREMKKIERELEDLN